jgi:hypothetical protein
VATDNAHPEVDQIHIICAKDVLVSLPVYVSEYCHEIIKVSETKLSISMQSLRLSTGLRVILTVL